MIKRKIVYPSLIVVLILIGMFAYGDDSPTRDKLRIAYISKDLEHYWFQQTFQGMEMQADILNIYIKAFDARFNDQLCLKLIEVIIDQGYDGLLICTTNQKLGPEISRMCEAAGVAVMTIDDPMIDHYGKAFPHIGMATTQVGAIGGKALVKMSKELNFPQSGENVHILQLDVPGLSVFQERLQGYESSIFSETNLTKDNVIKIDVPNGMYESNKKAMDDFFQNWEGDKTDYWIICGVNDDSALAPYHTLIEHGFEKANIIACGLGGYKLSIKEFERNNSNYVTVMLEPDIQGRNAVEMMFDHLQYGYELKASTIMGGKIATKDNYRVFFDNGQ